MLSGILISGREWKNKNKREDFALKLKSENLPICERELQQQWPPKPPENTPVFASSFFFSFFPKEETTENYLTIGNETKINE